jgi:CRP-like cAMP-binding protein
MHNHSNQLLARLDETTFAALKPHLAVVRLEHGRVISETHDTVRKVYFPHAGIISCVVELIGGGAIETGMIGKDGEYGAAAALDHKMSLNVVSVQMACEASVIDADHFRRLALENQRLRQLVMAYEQFFLAQVQQTSACNAVHRVEERACKWLLRMQKLAGDDLLLTQEFLANMMGVRRVTVTEIAVGLQAAGMISYKRGRIQILDLAKIRAVACECDAAVNAHYAHVFEGDSPLSVCA